jgi:YD repeat-containing protein
MGFTLVASAYLKQIGGQVYGYDFAKTRLSPKNETGGTNLYSRNFGWSSGLVGLSGRAGLNAGFGISYNSLVWTKHNNTMVFDADLSNVSPGFRFGFPTIEPVYYNDEIINPYFAYLMITPSGDRVEFRQIGASEYFETADSSYTQLKVKTAPDPNEPVEDIEITVKGTDGTQMTYQWKAGAFRCSEIKDRNGNFISINHDSQGLLRTVTDTLGRVITVNYDSELYPTSITQNWQLNNGESSTTTTRTYSTFVYTTLTVNPSFDSSLTVYGPTSGTVIKVLDKIIYGTSSSNTGETRFEYNDFGQVKKVRNMAADGHELSYVITNLHTPGTNLLDVPRLTQTKSWTENFNGGAEITFDNTFTENQTIPEASGNGTLITVSMTGHPNSAVSKTYVGSSGWMESLPIVTEDWADGARKRWTQTDWTQDDTNLSYVKNPRVTKTKVADNANVRRTEIDYWNTGSLAAFGLVKEVRIYNDGTNALQKKTITNYKDDAAYLSRRIIGLPSQSELYDGNGFLMSKVAYAYDEGNFNDNDLQQNISPIQHDNTNYGASFIIGRGNLTSVTRHDVLGQSSAVTSSIKYNTAGAVVAQIDPLGRTAKIGYADKFNDGGDSRNTFAYPTKVTDPAGYYSEAKYRFDAGANVWAKSPTPQGTNNSKGKETERIYDSFGRLERETLVNHGGAYTRYEYPSNGIQAKIYATLTTGAGEVMSERWTDGAGRIRYSRTEHPGSTGGWSGSKVEYDILGRVTRSTVPTEINPVNPANPATWVPAGDDDRGLDAYNNPVWLWNSQEYDWQGRVTRKINTDGTDQLISYDGCGCAGGLVTTIQSELVPRDDQPTQNARRKQKVYADILGREFKSEVFDWSGNVYSTTVQTFNGRDQVTQITQYAGAENPNNTHQDTILTYDGHGRLKTRHNPIEESQTNTTWIYNADDSIQQIIDPRGAITTYTYNDPRGLLTQISYDPPATPPTYTTIPDTPTVNFTYDAAGNRISMTDGTGSTSYSYDELSRLKSETKTFTGLTGNFTISYDYQLSGKLKSITDPFGAVVNYNDDKAGRTTSITGSNFLDVATYAGNIKYRAFGSVKEMTYGSSDNSVVSYQFNNRLQISSYQSTSTVQTGGYVRRATYEYFNDSKIKNVDNLIDSGFDQTYKFDFMGRLTSNGFGMKANNQNEQVQTYSQTIGYDAFGEMTSRLTGVWGGGDGFYASYINGRKQNSNEIYDASGNIVDKTTSSTVYDRWKFDAAGRLVESATRWYQGAPQQTSFDRTQTITNNFDGNGNLVKRVEARVSQQVYPPNLPPYTTNKTEYYVRSSVLNKVLTELDGQGAKIVTHVYTGESALAEQRGSTEVYWKHEDIITGSYQKIKRDGASPGTIDPPASVELEPLGGIVPQNDPNISDEMGGILNPADYRFGGDVHRPEFGCQLDYSPISCNLLRDALRFYRVREIQVNVRAEGGWDLYYRIQNQISINRYPVYQLYDNESVEGNNLANAGERWKIFGDKLGIHVGYFYLIVGSPFLDMVIAQTQQQLLVTLSANKDRAFRNALQELAERLKQGKVSEDCKKNVLDKLNTIEGFDLQKFIGFLQQGGDFYDGEKSNAPVSDYDPDNGWTISIAKRFEINEGLHAFVGRGSKVSRFTVFFDPDEIETKEKTSLISGQKVSGLTTSNLAFAFHEALHGYGQSIGKLQGETPPYGDTNLKDVLGLKGEGSKIISDHIEKNCFK